MYVGDKMTICPFVQRLCSPDCMAYNSDYEQCDILFQVGSISYALRRIAGTIPGEKK